MNGQRYQKKEEKSVVPPANAVVHLVRTNSENGKKERKSENKIEISKQTNKLIRETGESINCNKSIAKRFHMLDFKRKFSYMHYPWTVMIKSLQKREGKEREKTHD